MRTPAATLSSPLRNPASNGCIAIRMMRLQNIEVVAQFRINGWLPDTVSDTLEITFWSKTHAQ
jgi:hypothetical protein